MARANTRWQVKSEVKTCEGVEIWLRAVLKLALDEKLFEESNYVSYVSYVRYVSYVSCQME